MSDVCSESGCTNDSYEDGYCELCIENIRENVPAPEPVAAKQGDRYYALYFNGHSNEDIAKWFEEKYGYPPDTIIETGGGKLAGPLGKGDKRDGE